MPAVSQTGQLAVIGPLPARPRRRIYRDHSESRGEAAVAGYGQIERRPSAFGLMPY